MDSSSSILSSSSSSSSSSSLPSIRPSSHDQSRMLLVLVTITAAIVAILPSSPCVDSFTPLLPRYYNSNTRSIPLSSPLPSASASASTISRSTLFMVPPGEAEEGGAPKKKKKAKKKKAATKKKKKAKKKKAASTVASAKSTKSKKAKSTKAKKKAKKAKKASPATATATTITAAATATATAAATPQKSFSPSKITNDDSPTPPEIDTEPEEIHPEELSTQIPSSQYNATDVPIAHQPWRRGDTDGCEDPITAPWRIEAEELITSSAYAVGGIVTDVTWYMGAVVITIDDENLAKVHSMNDADINVGTPEIRVYGEEESGAMWFDPDDPEPEDDYGIYEGEEDGRVEVENEDGSLSSGIPNDPYLEREFDEVTGTFLPPPVRPTREEAVRNIEREEYEDWKNNGMTVELSDRDERIGKQKMSMEDFQLKLEDLRARTNLSEEEMEKRAKDLRAWYLRSEDLAEYYPEEFEKVGNEEALNEKLAMPVLERADGVDTGAIGIIAKAIIDALEDDDVEERIAILSRHEIVMTSPGPENYLETQREFDESRGKVVDVQTQDPFGSNRILVGKLVDRTALDVYINVMGRLVTIPLNMVAHVTLSDANIHEEEVEDEEAVGAV